MDCILPKYRLSEAEYKELWDNCTFVLDTNVIFNIYRYSPKIRDQILAILEKITEDLWIPYQVAFEYYDNRLEVISKEVKKFNTITDLIGSCQKPAIIIADKDRKEFKRKHTTSSDILDYLEKGFKDLETAFDTGLKEIKEEFEKEIKSYPGRKELDDLNEIVCSLFYGKVGKPYSIEELEDICDKGSKRYELMLPPGYEDKDKPGLKKYGDLIAWFQIMDYAKENRENIIFICDDLKDDWWWSPSDTTLGPRPELLYEFSLETKQLFYMYPTDRFMKWSKKYIDVDVKDAVIDELREYRVEEESRLKAIRLFREKYFDPELFKNAVRAASFEQETLAKIDPELFKNAIKAISIQQEELAKIDPELFKNAVMAASFQQETLAKIDPKIFKNAIKAISIQQEALEKIDPKVLDGLIEIRRLSTNRTKKELDETKDNDSDLKDREDAEES